MANLTDLSEKISEEYANYLESGIDNDLDTLRSLKSEITFSDSIISGPSSEDIYKTALAIAVKSRAEEYISNIANAFEQDDDMWIMTQKDIDLLFNTDDVLDHIVDTYIDYNNGEGGFDIREPEGMNDLLELTCENIENKNKKILENAKKLEEKYGRE